MACRHTFRFVSFPTKVLYASSKQQLQHMGCNPHAHALLMFI